MVAAASAAAARSWLNHCWIPVNQMAASCNGDNRDRCDISCTRSFDRNNNWLGHSK